MYTSTKLSLTFLLFFISCDGSDTFCLASFFWPTYKLFTNTYNLF